MKTQKITFADGKYEITFEDGKVVQCDALVSKGTKQKEKDGQNYDHLLCFSDGVQTKFVGSCESITIPDCSYL